MHTCVRAYVHTRSQINVACIRAYTLTLPYQYVHTRSHNHTTPRTQERNYGDLFDRHDETSQGPQGQVLLPWEEEQELARLEMHRAPGRMQWEHAALQHEALQHEALQDRKLPALLGDAEAEEGEEGRKGGRVAALEGGGNDVSRAGEGGWGGTLGAFDEGRVTLGPAALDPPLWIVHNKALSPTGRCAYRPSATS